MNRRNLSEEIRWALIDCCRRHQWRAEKEALFSPRRIDVLAIAPVGREVVAFEIKVSRGDFRSEMNNPEKRETVVRNCSQFYFAVPVGLISRSEVPDNCGLIYFSEGCLFLVKAAPRKRSDLPFEVDARMKEWDSEADCYWESSPVEVLEAVQLPNWMRPRARKPIRFDFDVSVVAEVLPHVFDIPLDINFEGLPF